MNNYITSSFTIILISSCIVGILPKNKTVNAVKICLSAVCVIAIITPIKNVIFDNDKLEISENCSIISENYDYFIYLNNIKSDYIKEKTEYILKSLGILNATVCINYIDDDKVHLTIKTLHEFSKLSETVKDKIYSELNIDKENISFEYY